MENIAVIILNYKSWQDTLKEIELLQNLSDFKDIDIVVVDNNSPNESYAELSKNSLGNFILLKADCNRGYASGNNIGLRYCYERGYKYVWILNNDIIIEDEKIIKKMLDIFLIDSNIAVVNPDIYSIDGHMFNRDAARPTFFDLTLGMFAYRKKGRKIDDKGGYGYVYRPQGCCMIMDLNKIHEIGYLDETTFLYSEEIILAERLLEKSYTCVCCTDCKVIHNHSKTVKSSIREKELRKIKINSFDYYLKTYREFKGFKRFLCRSFYSLKLRLLK